MRKARIGGRVVSQAVVIATSVTANGHREVLGVDVGDSETEDFWTEFLRSLRDRGLHGVQLVISDARRGLTNAISAVCAGSRSRRGTHTAWPDRPANARAKAAMSVSSWPQIRDTSDLEMPDSTPNAATRSSTLRVETPSIQACMITACNATSTLRRGQSSDGKNDPERTFGILTVMSPAAVDSSLNRPGESGDSKPWKGWGHVRNYVEEVPARAA